MARRNRQARGQSEYHYRSMTRGSLAVAPDYAQREYQQTEEQRHVAAQPQVRKKPRHHAAARPRASALTISPALILCGVAVVGVLLTTILGYVALNQISREIVQMKAEVATLKQENVDLTTKHELTFDLATIKQQAEKYGMDKPSDSQMYYVDLSGQDTARVYDTAQQGHLLRKIWDSLHTAFDVVVEYFN